MARHKGSKNKNSSALPAYTELPTKERIEVIANLVVDKIFEDLQNGRKILKALNGKGNA
jgi:hypothetical protein